MVALQGVAGIVKPKYDQLAGHALLCSIILFQTHTHTHAHSQNIEMKTTPSLKHQVELFVVHDHQLFLSKLLLDSLAQLLWVDFRSYSIIIFLWLYLCCLTFPSCCTFFNIVKNKTHFDILNRFKKTQQQNTKYVQPI